MEKLIVDGPGPARRVRMSDAEIAQRLAEEAIFAAELASPQYTIETIEVEAGLTREQRELYLAALPVENPTRQKAEIVEALIAPLRVQLNDPKL